MIRCWKCGRELSVAEAVRKNVYRPGMIEQRVDLCPECVPTEYSSMEWQVWAMLPVAICILIVFALVCIMAAYGAAVYFHFMAPFH